MKKLGLAVVCLLAVAATAAAQTPIDLDGATGRSTSAAPVTVLSSGGTTAVFGIGTFSPGGPFDAQFVIEFDMTGQPNAASATLTIWASNSAVGGTPGTWFLYAMTGVNEDGNLTSGDHLPSAAASFVGSTAMAATTGPTALTFNVTGPLNFDVNNARPYSGYILTYSGAGFVGSTTEPGGRVPFLTYTAVPEPGTIALFGLGLLSFAGAYRVRRKKKA